MKEILLVAGQELVVNLRRPGYIIMTLLIPALGLVALVLASLFGGEVGGFFESQFAPEQKALGFVDQSGLLTAGLPEYADHFIRYPDEASARAALLAGDISSYFVLPSDYLQTGAVAFYGTGGGFSTFVIADEGDLRAFLVDNLLAGKVDQMIQARVVDPTRNLQAVTLDEQGEVSTESPFSWLSDFVVPYVFSILFVITLFTTSGFLLQSVSEEKEGRIIEMLVSSISPTQLLAGKILGLGTVGLIQVAVWFGAGGVLLGAAVSIFALGGVSISPTTVLLALLYAGLGYLLYATLMAVAGSMGTTMRESQQIASVFSLAAAIPWVAIGFVFSNPNAPVAVVLSYFPLTAPVMMLIRLGFGEVPTAQILTSLVVLAASIAFSLWAGAKVFRVGLLMYGKRPSLKDLGRAFRQA
jgi:ABC-2 type transport system permease protein